jgi:pimeloyl-ACP methyl ester carboxylesterase
VRTSHPVPSQPFVRGPFEELPELPRVPHPFYTLASREIDVVTDAFPRFRCHVKVHGRGPPLLLVHGLMTSSYSYRYVVEELARHFTCYIPDLPGAGRSEAPVDVAYMPQALAHVVVGIQRALSVEGCACIANSMGGYLAMQAALLFGARTFEKLVMLHAPAIPLPRYRALQLAWALPGSRALFRALVRRDPLRWTHRNVHYIDESLKSLEEAREYAAPFFTDAGLEAFRRYLADTMRADGLEAFAHTLRRRRDDGIAFPVPMQLVYARFDPLVPAITGEKLHALLPQCPIAWLDNASHFAHVDAPRAFLDVALPYLRAP